MTRESRLVAVLLTISAAGVLGLSVVANQYRKALAVKPPHPSSGQVDASLRATSLVAGFLAARGKVKAYLSVYPGNAERLREDPEALRSYRVKRSTALEGHGMTQDDYATVRTGWRAYRAGRSVDDPSLVGAMAALGSALDEASLGPLEALDDAVN